MSRLQFNNAKEKTPITEQDPAVRATNFDEVSEGYTPEEAVLEAQRCIQCPKPVCVEGCPVGVPIPQFLHEVAQGNVADAYALVKSTNFLPAICGRVCPQESQCEGVCMRGRKGEPVAIGRLERFVADWAAQNRSQVEEALALKRKRDELVNEVTLGEGLSEKHVAMVGSGPASLTCAGELINRGVQVTVFEALHKAGGVLTYGIPEFRLPKDLVQREIDAIKEAGVTFELNSLVGKLYDVRELLDDKGFDAVFVGTGAGLPRYLGIPGEGLNGTMVANELLTRVNLMKAYRFPEYATPVFAGKKCIVVGGGNVAMDAARTARRLGAEVTVVYRRGRSEMPARAEEIEHALEEGIKLQTLTNPIVCHGDDKGWINKVECVEMTLGEPDASGRRSAVEVGDSNFMLECDMFVVAVGSATNPLIATTTPGLEVTGRNLIVANPETCATSIPGVFAGGDAVIGAATVIQAMGAGKRAAAGILDYLQGK